MGTSRGPGVPHTPGRAHIPGLRPSDFVVGLYAPSDFVVGLYLLLPSDFVVGLYLLLPSDFVVGKRIASRMPMPCSSITSRSTPKPMPPVGGMPYSSACT